MNLKLQSIRTFIFVITALLLICNNSIKAQDFYVSFVGQGSGTKVDSVIVENITQGIYTIVKGYDVLHLSPKQVGINNIEKQLESNILISPNPMSESAILKFYAPEAGNTTISIFDVSGRMLIQHKDYLSKGYNSYSLQGVPSGIYFIKIHSGSMFIAEKLVSTGNGKGNCSISKNSNVQNQADITSEKQSVSKNSNESKALNKSGKGSGYVAYNFGDRLIFTGIGNDIAVTTGVFNSDSTITFDFYPCTDGDGNKYATVKIGEQLWMAENLKTTKYNDGEDIPYISDSMQWTGRTAAYCWFKNNESKYKNLLGGDYNWYAVNTYKLCPSGWHVPSINEWQTMEDYLISHGYNYDNSTSGNMIGKSVATPFVSFIYLGSCILPNMWFQSTNTGVVGNSDYQTKFNSSGFSAIPTGLAGNQQFGVVGNTACFWSTTESNYQRAYFRQVNYDWEWFSQSLTDKIAGMSVRCLKD